MCVDIDNAIGFLRGCAVRAPVHVPVTGPRHARVYWQSTVPSGALS
jgi:hypothetical protein